MSEQEQAQTRQDIEARIIAKAWKDEAYKQELLTNPKAAIEREFGVEFPADVKVQVLEENSTSLHFVLPMSPVAIAQELSEEQLEAIAGGVGLSAVLITVKVTNAAVKWTPRASAVSAAASVGASIGAIKK
ncbi:NHLP leader peptide family natural product precursor [Nostoc sp. KVJ3]|uniref:NHLP leader peptide family RiPP precursor n=1 Tax=Nostoc sp. KVJ3 TaxID=457945 RepID=UPI0022382D61|nr:NHLP leader peptide family RiPP precursor [Nostoc sp. KVJ3]MCW5315517.1 NHLP leader peptide family natural product precursor [Nostoc sp. KVJ3]